MQLSKTNNLLFSDRYRIQRHMLYWLCYLLVWTTYWTVVHLTFFQNFLKMLVWLPAFMLFTYPVIYLIVPKLLLKNKYLPFIGVMLTWGVFGWILNSYFRVYVFFPITEWAHVPHGTTVAEPSSFLCMTTTSGCMTISSLTKRWVKKQQDWLQAE